MNLRSQRQKGSTDQSSPTRQAQCRENNILPGEGYVEENAALEDDLTTPKSTRRSRPIQSSSYSDLLAHRPVLRSSNTDSSASFRQSGKSKRATSPSKTYRDLKLLNKPVKYAVMDAERDDWPEDVRLLVENLQVLCENVGIIPSNIQDHIPAAKKRSHWTYETSRDDLDLMIELDVIKRVQAAAASLSVTGDHEQQWYCSVQWPLLDTAFRHQSHIEPKQISHAVAIKECLPQTGDRYSDSRLVDFAVNLIPQSVSEDYISECLRRQPDSLRSVNQTLYTPLCWHPTIISIEVKVTGSEEEARVQIGIWLSAWHERVAQLVADEDHRVITLPVIIVLNHNWYLYFAVDKGSHIEILQFTESIGDTLSLVKIYRILAVLRRLGEWGLDTFEPWFKTTVLNLA